MSHIISNYCKNISSKILCPFCGSKLVFHSSDWTEELKFNCGSEFSIVQEVTEIIKECEKSEDPNNKNGYMDKETSQIFNI